jgi:putative transposase
MTSAGAAHAIGGMPPAARRREARLQRAVSRKARGSKRHQEAERRLARHQRRCARRRLHAVHRAVNAVLATTETVVLEALDVQAMTASAKGTAEQPGTRVRQKAGLNRAILDRAWGEAARVLVYKARWWGRRVVTVRAARSSITCAECQHVDADSRETQARFRCTRCEHVDHADRNAGRVLAQRYRRGEIVAVLASGPEDAALVAALEAAAARAASTERARSAGGGRARRRAGGMGADVLGIAGMGAGAAAA